MMYTEDDRNNLLEQITEFVKSAPEFEGLLQIGSGAVGYTDIYSDLDFMAGCTDAESVPTANDKLISFFDGMDCVCIDHRRWSSTVYGLSAYFENGLSVDISFMPTNEIKIKSPRWKILLSKSTGFSSSVERQANISFGGIDNSIHHKFVYALRRCEIALCRGEYIYADISLSEARQLLLLVEVACEGKKIHQFKAFNTLAPAVLEQIDKTYPVQRDSNGLKEAKENLLSLYLDVVNRCNSLTFDEIQLKLLNRFE